jgi:hypothetical protein
VASGNTGDFRVRRHILRDYGAGAGGGFPADADGGDEHGVAANESTIFDHGLMLVLAVVVAGDGARADIHVRAHRCVADVAEVTGAATGPDARGFDLDEIPDVHAGLEMCAWPEVAEGSDVGAIFDDRAFDDGGRDRCRWT